MRKPHQHERDGIRFNCADPTCRMPFKLQRTHHSRNDRKTLRRVRERSATREEQYARYLDCGPLAWDDRDGGE